MPKWSPILYTVDDIYILTVLSFDNILSYMNDLTAKQRGILEFIAKEKQLGNTPSQREIAAHFGLSQNAICQFVRYLRAKGYIEGTGRHRGVKLSANGSEQFAAEKGILVLGRIAAGEPILAQENIEDRLDLNQMVAQGGGKFFLKVTGDSMADVGIMDGDYVAVSPDAPVKSGDIAAVMLGDEATVKRIYFEKDRVVLKAENRAGSFRNRHIRKMDAELRVIGKVTGCFRDIK
jgi:repressor LexA